MDVYHREGRIFRFQPRTNLDVNQYWMCDVGRLSWMGLQGESRLLQALVRGTETFEPTQTDAAVTAAGERLRAIAAKDGRGAVAVIVSAQASNEEVFLARRLAAALDGSAVGFSWSPPGATGDEFLVKADKNPNTRGLAAQGLSTDRAGVDRVVAGITGGTIKALVLVRTDLTRWLDDPDVARALESLAYLVVVDSDRRDAAQFADVVLPAGPYTEGDGTFTNHAGRVQRFAAAVPAPGDARAGWQLLGSLVAAVTSEAAAPTAGAVFDALAREGGAFAGFDYDALGTLGRPATNARASA
jgi:NADH-quinone oxidoreductase subunit G